MTAQPTDGIGGTDEPMSSAHLTGVRYAAIRKALANGRPLDNSTYLLAQIALVMCDAADELSCMRADITELTAHMHEIISTRPLPQAKP